MNTINYTFPLWTIIILIVTSIYGVIHNGFRFYIKNREMSALIDALEKRINIVDDKFSRDLESHKDATSKEFARLNSKLDTHGTTLTRVETMVGMLLKNRE